MNSMKKTLALACAASVLSFGVAFAQHRPGCSGWRRRWCAPAADAAPAADTMAKKPMMKKHSMKKMSKKKMMKKKPM